jgi:hypothetical protein
MAAPPLSPLTDPTVQISTQRVPQAPLPAQFQERVIQGSNVGQQHLQTFVRSRANRAMPIKRFGKSA